MCHLENPVGENTCTRLLYVVTNICGVSPGSVKPEAGEGKLSLRKKEIMMTAELQT